MRIYLISDEENKIIKDLIKIYNKNIHIYRERIKETLLSINDF